MHFMSQEGNEHYSAEGLTVISVTQTRQQGLSGGQKAGVAIAVIILIAIVILVIFIIVLGVFW